MEIHTCSLTWVAVAPHSGSVTVLVRLLLWCHMCRGLVVVAVVVMRLPGMHVRHVCVLSMLLRLM